ncbi:MAG TPA: hypothetical protein VFI91_11320 [Longimicrobiaceae bacterium]|nr:hypothetical protein [Longimicrobiaceae bacterium]
MSDKRLLLALSLVVALVASAAPASAQGETTVVYHREVFDYGAEGRPDPFRSLLETANLGYRFEDLSLQGVVYNPDPRLSVAVLTQTGSERQVQAHVGERLGSIRVLAIHPRRIEVAIEEFGVTRRESLELNLNNEKGSGS